MPVDTEGVFQAVDQNARVTTALAILSPVWALLGVWLGKHLDRMSWHRDRTLDAVLRSVNQVQDTWEAVVAYADAEVESRKPLYANAQVEIRRQYRCQNELLVLGAKEAARAMEHLSEEFSDCLLRVAQTDGPQPSLRDSVGKTADQALGSFLGRAAEAVGSR